MAGLVNIGEMGALALHVLVELAKRREEDPEARLNVADLADKLQASPHTLHKVARRLVDAGLAESARGAAGGLRLAVPAAEISMMRVVEEVDGRICSNGCLFEKRVCPASGMCPFDGVTKGLEEQIRNYLHTTTVEDLRRSAT